MAAERKMAVCGELTIQYRASMIFLFCYVFSACLVHHGVEAGLTLSKTCGEVSCSEHEFCSDFDKRCHRCDTVCEKSSRNFQEDVCFKDCQDYLHDRQYVRRGGDNMDTDVEMLGDAVRRLTQMVIASLVITAIILVLFSGSVCLMWRRSRRTIGGDGGEGGQPDGDVASYLRGKVSSAKNPFKKDKSASAANAPNGLKLDIVVANPNATQQQSNSRQTPQPQAPLPPERTSASTPRSEGGKSEATDAYSPTTTTSALSNRPPRYPSEDTTLDYAYDNRALTPSPRFDKGGNGQQHPPTPYHHPQQMGLGVKGETTF